MKFLDYDSPIMSWLSRIYDVMILNFLTLLFCIPVITIGAATTAAHYTSLKLRRNEGQVFRCFWKSFRENFKQSTVVWIVFCIHCFLLYWAFSISSYMDNQIADVLRGIIVATSILTVFIYAWVLPLQSRFINPITATLKNAFYMAFRYILRTVLMAVFNLLPIGLLVFAINTFGIKGLGAWLLFGISAPIYWCAITYDKVFEKWEEIVLESEK